MLVDALGMVNSKCRLTPNQHSYLVDTVRREALSQPNHWPDTLSADVLSAIYAQHTYHSIAQHTAQRSTL